MRHELAIILLFSIATGVALLVRRLRVPYTVALLVTGLALGPTHLVAAPELRRELLYAIFLPGLLFEAAYHLKWDEFRRAAVPIVSLAVPGVLVAMVVTAGLVVLFHRWGGGDPLGFGYALVFAAIIAATDPIAVVALFRELGAPRGLRVLVEGESLLNDGTAVVLFSLATAYVTGGVSWASAILDFFRVLVVGIGVGAAFGLAVATVMKRVDDPMIEITMTVITAYGSFAVAEQVRGSGVLATVTAGMLSGSYAAEVAMSPNTRAAVGAFWEYVAFALNSLVFLLIGFTVQLHRLLAAWRTALVAYVVSVLARAAMVSLAALLLQPTRHRIAPSWTLVLGWGGLRGALSMVLALALPAEFPHRDTIVGMTIGVVLLSILVQGLSIAKLLVWTDVGSAAPASRRDARHRTASFPFRR